MLLACAGLAAAAADPTAAANSFSVDIHLPVLGASAASAQRANAFLNTRLGNTEVDLGGRDKPHVTLYLTQWSCPPTRGDDDDDGGGGGGGGGGPPASSDPAPKPTCVQRIQLAVADNLLALATGPAATPCEVGLSAPYAAGQYAMMNVTNAACLQRASDLVVNATHALSAPNQTAPSWVHALPEPERSEKLRDIALFGSPNVFGQFAPHVTIGWAEDADAVAAAVAALAASGEVAPTTFGAELVVMGSVGAHGTVLEGADLGVYNVSWREADPCRKRYSSFGSCGADNTTDGGCVWCDIVDHPAFCTTNYLARQYPPPPQMPPFNCNWHK